jgi:hypothetical protein
MARNPIVLIHGYSDDGAAFKVWERILEREAKWDATLNISSLADDTGIKFFYPFTTTLIELRLNREPLPP